MAAEGPDKKKLEIRRGVPERIVTSVVPPRNYPLPSGKLWVDGKPDTDALREHLFHEGRLEIADVHKIFNMANAIFREEPNVLTIEAPIASMSPFFLHRSLRRNFL
jgi:hypothetical protein